MAVNDVELTGAADDLLELHHEVRHVSFAGGLQAQRARHDRDQPRRGHGVAAREQRHFMAAPNEFLGDRGHHALRAAVFRGRDALGERRDLRDAKLPGGAGLRQ